MPEPEKLNYASRTRRALRQIVEDAASEPPLFTPLDLREIGPNAVADLTIRWRADPRLPNPDECERAILELLYRNGRTRHKDIVAQLREWFAEITIRRRLEGMLVAGVVRNNVRTPRGYDLDPKLRNQQDAINHAGSA